MACDGAPLDIWRFVEKLLTCSNCGNLFIYPKIIPCLHTFCSSCLEGSDAASSDSSSDSSSNSGSVNCPTCHAHHSDDSVATDSYIQRLQEEFSSRFSQQLMRAGQFSAGDVVCACGKCEEDNPSTLWCVDCQTSLCESCSEEHRSCNDTGTHQTEPMEAFLNNPLALLPSAAAPISSDQPEHCSTHPQHMLHLFCTTCNSLVCLDCILSDHRGHTFTTSDVQLRDDGKVKHDRMISILIKVLQRISYLDHLQEAPGHLQDAPTSDQSSAFPRFIAKYDYVAQMEGDLSFKEGESLYIVNKDDGDWWYARAQRGLGEEGYVPNNYIVEYGAIDTEDWYFGAVDHAVAKAHLMQPFNQCGSFLVCDSETTPGDYSLWVRDIDNVSHYKICRLHTGGFFVTHQLTFETVPELVAHYSKQTDGLCVNLRFPCLSSELSGTTQDTNDTWKIDRKLICIVMKLGAGRFSEVWQGVWKNTTPVAVKTIKPSAFDVSKFHEEAALMMRLRDPHVVQLFGVCTQEEPFYMVMELVEHGSLLEHLQRESSDGRPLQLSQLIDMGAQVAAGMAYLEEKSCIHRDVAARNILVSENLKCKLADFGLAHIEDDDIYGVYEAHAGAKFPIKWTAPEAALYNRFTIKSDVWSFGILMYELVTHGKVPYPGMNNVQVLQDIQTGYRMPCPADCPYQLYKVMKDCWKEEAASRPTFKSLQWQLEEFFTYDGTQPAYGDVEHN